jgi:hypothetical protein
LLDGGTRRGLLRLAASLPVASALSTRIGADTAMAKKRKKRRK